MRRRFVGNVVVSAAIMRRVLLYGLLASVFLGVVAVVAVGLWLDDERLTKLANNAASGAVAGRTVQIGQVHRDGWHRLVVSDVHVSAPNEPARDAIWVKQAEVVWHWTPLLRREFLIEKLRVNDVTVDLVSDASSPASRMSGFDKPNLPLRIVLRQGEIAPVAVKVGTSARTFTAENIVISATADASNDTLHGTVTMQHERSQNAQAIDVIEDGHRKTVASELLKVTVIADSWLSGGISLEQAGRLFLEPREVGRGAPAAGSQGPSVASHVNAKMRFDAARGDLILEQGDVSLGEAAKAKVALSVHNAWKEPQLQLDALNVDIDLGALQPLFRPLMPGVQVSGQIALSGEPATVTLGATAAAGAAPVTVLARMNRVSASYDGTATHDVSGTMLARYCDEAASVALAMRLGDVQRDPSEATDVAMTLWASVGLSGGVVDAAAPVLLDTQLATQLAKSGDASLRDLGLNLYSTGTLGWLQGHSDASPLNAETLVHWRTMNTGGAHAGPGSMVTTARVEDRAATRVRAQVALNNARIEMPAKLVKVRHRDDDATDDGAVSGEHEHDSADDDDNLAKLQPWVLPALKVQTTVVRNHDAVSLEGGRVTLGRVSMGAEVALENVRSDAPHIARFDLDMPVTPLTDLVALSPPPRIDTGALNGTMRAKVTARGDVPYEALAAQAALPHIDDDLEPDDFEAWEGALHAYAAWARGWIRRFDAGFPFTLHGDLSLNDVDFSNAEASVTDLTIQAQCALEPHTVKVQAHVSVPEAPAPTPTPVRGVAGDFNASYEKGLIQTHAHLSMDTAALGGQPTPLEGIGVDLDARYAVDGDMHLDTFDVRVKNRGFSVHGEGLIEEPLDALATRAWLRPGFADMRASTHWRVDFSPPDGVPMSLAKAGPTVSGQIHLDTGVEMAHGMLAGEGDIHFDDFSVMLPTASLSHVSGSLPMKLSIRVGEGQDAVIVARNLSFGGGVLSVVSDAEDIRNRPARPVYYDRLRPYRQGHGIRAEHAQSGPYEVTDIALEGRIENGMLLADWVGMNILGGDVAGNFGLQLGRDSTLRGDVTLKASNIDASYFPILHLRPGLDSEMSADTRLSFLLGEDRRDLSANVNVTKLGPRALDRFLQLLDPTGANAGLQRARSNLWVIGSIREMAMWIRFENLNVDIQYVPLLHIPFTDVGYRPIERELLRRLSLTEFLDFYEPMADAVVGPFLGWNRAH